MLISHLFYMDDLKLYTRSVKEVQSLLNSVSIYTISMRIEGSCVSQDIDNRWIVPYNKPLL